MKQVKVQVEFLPSNQGSISNINLPTGNNISNTETSLKEINGGANCFVLGASKLGSDPFYNNKIKYNGFFSNILTSVDGKANINISISGTNIDNFVINFDNIAQQWATEIYVDGIKWTNTNSLFFWNGEKSNSHTVSIKKWNKPLYPIRITSVLVGIAIDYDSTCLIEAIRGSQSMSDNSQPNLGVVSGYGNVIFVDKHKELIKLAELGLLKPDLKIKFFYGDTLIGDYLAEKWSYSYDSSRATVTLTDSLIRWQDMNFEGTDMTENATAYDVYLNFTRLSVPETFVIDSATISRLQSIKIKYLELTNGKLYEAWNKLCKLASIAVYKLENGKVKVVKL